MQLKGKSSMVLYLTAAPGALKEPNRARLLHCLAQTSEEPLGWRAQLELLTSYPWDRVPPPFPAKKETVLRRPENWCIALNLCL
jgi:hypothetical protein